MIMSATIHTRTNPVLIDGVIAEIQAQMAQRVEWLNNIFGRVERLVKNVNGRTIYSANQYKGGNEYTLIAPDSGLGNFAFFVVDEPETMDYYRGDRTHFSTPFSLVVWVDMRTIASGENRNTEAVKQEIVRFLNDELRLRSGRMYVNRIFNRAESIFKGFTLDEIDNQFLMQPFCGWRFEGEIEFYDTCAPYIPPVPPVEPPTFEIWVNERIETFSFVVNENETITIPINNYYGRWVVDREITSLKKAFANNTMWKEVKIKKIKLNFSIYAFAQNCSIDFRHYIDISECELATTDYYYFSGQTLTTIYAPKITSSLIGFLSGVSNLIVTDDVLSNVSIGGSYGMSKEGVLSLINFAARNNTYTLHSTIYNKCASGGEWHTDIQAAIDAKAAQGFIVTLISA